MHTNVRNEWQFSCKWKKNNGWHSASYAFSLDVNQMVHFSSSRTMTKNPQKPRTKRTRMKTKQRGSISVISIKSFCEVKDLRNGHFIRCHMTWPPPPGQWGWLIIIPVEMKYEFQRTQRSYCCDSPQIFAACKFALDSFSIQSIKCPNKFLSRVWHSYAQRLSGETMACVIWKSLRFSFTYLKLLHMSWLLYYHFAANAESWTPFECSAKL